MLCLCLDISDAVFHLRRMVPTLYRLLCIPPPHCLIFYADFSAKKVALGDKIVLFAPETPDFWSQTTILAQIKPDNGGWFIILHHKFATYYVNHRKAQITYSLFFGKCPMATPYSDEIRLKESHAQSDRHGVGSAFAVVLVNGDIRAGVAKNDKKHRS